MWSAALPEQIGTIAKALGLHVQSAHIADSDADKRLWTEVFGGSSLPLCAPSRVLASH